MSSIIYTCVYVSMCVIIMYVSMYNYYALPSIDILYYALPQIATVYM